MSRKFTDRFLYSITVLSAAIAVIMLLTILTYILYHGIRYIDWKFLTTAYKGQEHGILPMIVSTIYIIILSMVIATPIGIATAIYLVEYAHARLLVQIIRFAIESLAGIPSIIYGLFGFMFFVTALHFKMSLLSGALTLSIMILPLIIRTTEEALKAVPDSYREGSMALGATQLMTIVKIILPSAAPGIVTSVILSIGRIVGETAAIYLTAGMVTRIPENIMDSGRTLSVHLYILAKEGISFEQTYATAVVLLVIVAVINFLTGRLTAGLKNNDS